MTVGEPFPMMRYLPVLAALSAFVIIPAWGEEVSVRLPVRSDAEQPFLYDGPDEIKAVAILFPGGEGVIGIDGEGPHFSLSHEGNFLVRSRKLLASAGIATVTMDVPSDRKSGIDDSFRIGTSQNEDVSAVIGWLRQRTTAPIWLVGTSRGSISAASVALDVKHAVAGLVLTSSVDQSTRRHPFSGVNSLPVERLDVPVLVMDHVDESCSAVGDPDALAARMTGSPRVEVREIEGGSGGNGDACGPFSPHGYIGVEDKAIAAISEFILRR